MREGRKKGLPIEAEKEEGDVKQPSFVAKEEGEGVTKGKNWAEACQPTLGGEEDLRR